jgi:hypothetical protein
MFFQSPYPNGLCLIKFLARRIVTRHVSMEYNRYFIANRAPKTGEIIRGAIHCECGHFWQLRHHPPGRRAEQPQGKAFG